MRSQGKTIKVHGGRCPLTRQISNQVFLFRKSEVYPSGHIPCCICCKATDADALRNGCSTFTCGENDPCDSPMCGDEEERPGLLCSDGMVGRLDSDPEGGENIRTGRSTGKFPCTGGPGHQTDKSLIISFTRPKPNSHAILDY